MSSGQSNNQGDSEKRAEAASEAPGNVGSAGLNAIAHALDLPRTCFSKSPKSLFILIALWLLLYASFSLLRPPLLDDADSVHSEVAREMIARQDWVTLHANGIRYLEKAPLMYWAMALSYLIFGPRDWAARLPVALCVLLLVLTTEALGRRMFGAAKAGFYAALVLLTSCGIFLYTRIMIPDIIVCFLITAAMLLFWLSLEEERPSRATAWGFAAVCALNVLTKGLIGIVFPLAIVFLFLYFTRNLRHLARWRPFSSLLIFLAIALPWHIAAALANPAQGNPHGTLPTLGNVHGFLWFYFVNEQYLRYLNERVPRDYDTAPILIFWGLLIVWLMPWVAFLFHALSEAPWLRILRRRPLAQRERALLLLSIWAAFVMLFFSFSTRQEYYVLPALPALALLIGGWLAEEELSPLDSLRRNAGRKISAILCAFCLAGAAAAAFFAWRGHPPPPGTDISTLLSQNAADYALSLGHFMDLSTRAMGAFRVPLLLTAAAFAAGPLMNLLLRAKGKIEMANYALTAMMVVFLIAAHMALVTFSPVLSSKKLADAIGKAVQPGDVVEINGEYEAGSTLGFYLRRQIRILNGRSSNLWYGSFFPDAPAIFDTSTSFARIWMGSRRVFLWTELDNAPALPGTVRVLAVSGGKEILTNRN